MSTVIYLGNQMVQVVIGSMKNRKICVQQCYEGEAPEGSIINGLVMDTELFVEFMKGFWDAHKLPRKDVVLVVNSNKFTGKSIEMPELNEKKTRDFIQREFADIRKENCLYSYLPLGGSKGKTKRLYAESIEPEFIKDYMDIFHEIGIQLKSIVSGEGSLIGLTAMTVGTVSETFALIIADSSILTTILWIDGAFYYCKNMRSFHEQETEGYASDVAKSVSQIIQFMQAHQIEQQLEKIVLAGIDRSNLSMYSQAVEQMGIQTPVELFETSALMATGEADTQTFMRSASGLSNNIKYQDFLRQYVLGEKKKSGKQKPLSGQVVAVLVMLILMLLAVVLLFSIYLLKKSELDVLEAENNSSDVISSVAAYDMENLENMHLNAQRSAIASIDENIQTYPIFDSALMEQIEACANDFADITFHSFDAAEGTVQMTASSDTVEKINRFISKLNQQDIFETVAYTGYSYNEMNFCWDIHVTCTLAEAAGR